MTSPDNTEIVKLRVSLARIAAAAGFELSFVPGAPVSWAYEELVRAASTTERGWNALASSVVDRVLEGKL